MRRQPGAVLAMLAVLLSYQRGFAADALTILRLAGNQAGRVSYSATRIVQFPSQRIVIHVYWAGPGRERQEADWGHRRLLYVQNGNQAWCSGQAVVGSATGPFQPWSDRFNLPLVTRNYRVQQVAGGILAGRPASCLVLTPVLADRPTRRLWVDQATGLILRQEVLTQGRVTFAEYLSQVRFSPSLPTSLFQPPSGVRAQRSTGSASLSQIEQRLGRKLLLPHHLPPGFVLADSRLVTSPRGAFAHLSYTDGLSVLSLFEMPAAKATPDSRAGWLVPGEVVDLLTWTSQGMHLTLAADLPERVLREIASSVR